MRLSFMFAFPFLLLALSAASAPATSPVDRAYAFLDSALDQFARTGPRLPSSYARGALDTWDNSVLYDDALVIIAYARDVRADAVRAAASLRRARDMGDALVLAQARDPAKDGRLRNAYGPEGLWTKSASGAAGVNIQTPGSASGNLAWAGIALCHLAHVTGNASYTAAATQLARHVVATRAETRPGSLPGYTGGVNNDDIKILWKSTEHNIDLLAFFSLLRSLTGDTRWGAAADAAAAFVRAMWNAAAGRWEIGTLNDGATVNVGDAIPEDVLSWGALVTRSSGPRNATRALDFMLSNLQVTDGTAAPPITGPQYALQRQGSGNEYKNDKTVWLEGAAHMALALKCAAPVSTAHRDAARTYLAGITTAQISGPDANGTGIPANSRIGYAGGDDRTTTSLHTGTTAWFIMAQLGIDPFRLGGRC